MLTSQDIYVTVVDARFCKQLVNEHEILITVEEGSIGGFGSHVSHFLSLSIFLDGSLKVYFFFFSFSKYQFRASFLKNLSFLLFGSVSSVSNGF